jgi:hypothetical protein
MTSNICAMPSWTSPTSQPWAGPVLAEGQLTGGRDLQAHLVFDVGDEDAVALARGAGLGIEEELRHQEQRQALGTGTCALGAGQHQVQDVLEQVIGVGGGDEPLHAVDVPRAVVCLTALVRPAPTSEPASGSVRTMVEPQPRSAARGGPLLLLLGAQVVVICAKPAPPPYIQTAGWRRARALDGPHQDQGIGMPPSSLLTRSQPPSMKA